MLYGKRPWWRGLVNVIRDQSDIDRGVETLVRLDARLLPVVEAAGPIPLRLSAPGFAGLATIIVSQMVSRASAQAIWRRIEACGPVTASSYGAHTPEIIATFGLSRAKAATLQGLALAVMEDRVDLDRVCRMETSDAIRQLTALPGVGPWSAEVYLMFCAGHPDIFPVGDVALQAAVGHALGLKERPMPKDLAEMAQAWRPWRSVAARVFWAYYASRMRRETMPVV
ncbi:DNA-3-methyladenine glycosylase 2 family protein [Neorhizobium lilium]|uniref:DNA-3-methyladenine glycosylase II n=1 Tax=Neorhizobium lilium TaxID=2503024 RepID=A0A3S3STF4_9HYPH|nr:DNA-3-methyladenine glycosylase [Neorhizobium lilium]RWX74378.1 DNA-3-methyladenine glycosylase 2 family protein [Neorhizobium lilium]